MKVTILNYLGALKFVPDTETLAIRIYDSKKQGRENIPGKYSLQENELFVGEIGLTFDDIPVSFYPEVEQARLISMYECFNRTTAEALLRKFQKYFGESASVGVNHILAHCNAGISRSPAVVRAISTIFGVEMEWSGKRTQGLMGNNKCQGNEFVYDVLVSVAEELGIK